MEFVEFEGHHGYAHKYICRAPELPAIIRSVIIDYIIIRRAGGGSNPPPPLGKIPVHVTGQQEKIIDIMLSCDSCWIMSGIILAQLHVINY